MSLQNLIGAHLNKCVHKYKMPSSKPTKQAIIFKDCLKVMHSQCGERGDSLSKGRIYQDFNFEVDFVENRVIEQILALVTVDKPDNRPMTMNLKLDGLGWQRYFLAAWARFWEDWGEYIIVA